MAGGGRGAGKRGGELGRLGGGAVVRDSLEAWRVVTFSAENEAPEKSRERERRFRRTDMGMKKAGLAVLSPKAQNSGSDGVRDYNWRCGEDQWQSVLRR